MGVTERRAREKEELHDRILQAATTLFAEEGYASVSLRKIAERIEYAPSTIYLYFRDKDEIITSVCRQNFQLLTEALDAILLTRNLPPLEMLRVCLRAYIQFGLEHPDHYVVTFCLPQVAGKIDCDVPGSLGVLDAGVGRLQTPGSRVAGLYAGRRDPYGGRRTYSPNHLDDDPRNHEFVRYEERLPIP